MGDCIDWLHNNALNQIAIVSLMKLMSRLDRYIISKQYLKGMQKMDYPAKKRYTPEC